MFSKYNIKTLRLTFFILLSAQIFSAQKKVVAGITYLDANEQITTKDKANFYFVDKKFNDSLNLHQKYLLKENRKAVLTEKYYLNGNNQKTGKYESFFDNGQKKIETYYHNNNRHGPFKIYSQLNDSLKRDTINTYLSHLLYYKNGLPEGKAKGFYPNGRLKSDENFKDGHITGVCHYYFDNGQMSSYEVYDEMGNITSVKQWNRDGKKVKKRNIKNFPVYSQIQKDLLEYLNLNSNKNIVDFYHVKKGSIIAVLDLTEKGELKIIEIVTLKKVPEAYIAEVKRLIQNYAKHHKEPVYIHNLPANFHFTIPVTLKLSRSQHKNKKQRDVFK